MKKGTRRLYHKKYYRIRTLARLRKQIIGLKNMVTEFLSSPEGQEYLKRKRLEYQRDYREKNMEKIRKYQKEYQETYATF